MPRLLWQGHTRAEEEGVMGSSRGVGGGRGRGRGRGREGGGGERGH